MPRATRTFETTNGHKVVVLEYFTGREAQDIAAKVGSQGANTPMEKQLEANNYTITMAIKELDGTTENILDRVLDLPMTDFNDVSQAVQALVAPQKKTETQ